MTRRTALGALAAPLLLAQDRQHVERWGVYEVTLSGPRDGNPFVDVRLSAEFRRADRSVPVDGFYDGDGAYKIRFSPDAEGEWRFATHSNSRELDGRTGSFVCTPPAAGNHGPVVVRNTHHFGYADGTPYIQIGTTCYAWTHQPDALQDQTVSTLRAAPFNKLRMCVFPKWYNYNRDEPRLHPIIDRPGFTRFEPLYWRNLEKRVAQLAALGIEADLILFHPYDHWGYALMGAEADARYLRYTVARMAAFRNVWWSVANEWDLVKGKTKSDWDRYFEILQAADPYGRLRSIHHSRQMYDQSLPCVTHASIQGEDFQKIPAWREEWAKPVIFDECKYEGNIPSRWGDLSAQEMVRRFWLGTVYGGYVGHGETYLDPKDILWWSKGGVLHGQSAPRIAFLRSILEAGPAEGLAPLRDPYYPAAGKQAEYYLYYLDFHQAAQVDFPAPTEGRFAVDVIDPWEMTVASAGLFSGRITAKLPGRPGLALRLRKSG
ncbi:MAG TPA: DUF5060 domain-containing protein [Candidatus Sulfopaludibacter sp.]|nr:DUF5060 domain-containing protein [Candidatus Sulfopaludibacter sp.]